MSWVVEETLLRCYNGWFAWKFVAVSGEWRWDWCSPPFSFRSCCKSAWWNLQERSYIEELELNPQRTTQIRYLNWQRELSRDTFEPTGAIACFVNQDLWVRERWKVPKSWEKSSPKSHWELDNFGNQAFNGCFTKNLSFFRQYIRIIKSTLGLS